jgi:hypothetical protein
LAIAVSSYSQLLAGQRLAATSNTALDRLPCVPGATQALVAFVECSFQFRIQL